MDAAGKDATNMFVSIGHRYDTVSGTPHSTNETLD